MICEKCWTDAYQIAYDTRRSQAMCYEELLKERKDCPCSPREQAGEWWNEKKQCDSRLEIKKEQ